MSTSSPEAMRIRVDAANPGHFFACCGLLELAARLQPTAMGWFEPGFFRIGEGPSLAELIEAVRKAPLTKEDEEDVTASPILMGAPFALRLDWWKADDRAVSDLKVWAGTMESFRMAAAMQNAMRAEGFLSEDLLNIAVVAYDPTDVSKKVEPFYFDARRGSNAHSRDLGFAPNDLGMTTTACPAVELLCLVGLQRCQPQPTERRRVFDYHLWSRPIPRELMPIATCGWLPDRKRVCYRFESWFRTGQRKHKAFLPAQLKQTSH